MRSTWLKRYRIPLLFILFGVIVYSRGVMATYDYTCRWSDREVIRFGDDLRGMWLWPVEGKEPYPAVLLANGAVGTLEYNLPLAVELGKHGVACFLFDFATQGGSGGTWDPERGLWEATKLFRSHPRVDPDRLAASGHSMGGRLLQKQGKEPFQARVIFGMSMRTDDRDVLFAYSRYEFIFDRPETGNVVEGPWTGHSTGPMDPVLLKAAVEWIGAHLGFERVHPVTSPQRVWAQVRAFLGMVFIVMALLMFFPRFHPAPHGDAQIPPVYLWITSVGTLILPVFLVRRESPLFHLHGAPRWRACLLGALFFLLLYALTVGFASWSYFDVVFRFRKLWFFLFCGIALSFVMWHDQALLHGRLIGEAEVKGRHIWLAAFTAGAARWFIYLLIFLISWTVTGRAGLWQLLSLLCVGELVVEGLGVALSVRARHPLAGAVFLGLTRSWLWTVFLPL